MTNHLNGHRFMSWPEFWHHFGNKWPVKIEHSDSYHPTVYISKIKCCFCAIDSQSRYWVFSDGGVVVTGGPLLEAPQWAGLNTPTTRTVTHVEALSQ